ncbi:hypothetical protein SGI62_004395 [Enterobacter hormaechei]|uniref:hypothetical protein n=1 Tax=Enterobacter hormaechei TaxID=158836 RepID=UPI0013D26527|nr:hypothetical protein [Enterobacter hormaechei]ELV3390474.1 hypothetical protein [Enterobacter hormaechei]
MSKLFFVILFSISLLILIIMVMAIQNGNKTDSDISCLAVQSTTHGDFSLHGEFDFLFSNKKGRVRINGITVLSGKVSIVSRQIFFSYTHYQSDFVLKSQQVQLMNNGDATIANGDFNHHFPAFFSQEEKQLSITIRQDRSGNFVMYFADVPVFYCEPKY